MFRTYLPIFSGMRADGHEFHPGLIADNEWPGNDKPLDRMRRPLKCPCVTVDGAQVSGQNERRGVSTTAVVHTFKYAKVPTLCPE